MQSDAGDEATSAPRAFDSRCLKGAGVGHTEKMTECGGDGIGDVRFPGRAGSCQQPRNHRLDLFLLRATVAGHRFLDRRRTVFDDPQPGNSEGGEDDPARVGELERRARTDTVKRSLDGGFRWDMLGDNGENYGVQSRQPFRER